MSEHQATVVDESRIEAADRWFRDPVTGRDCLLILAPKLGVQHPECDRLADVAGHIDAFYCPACRRNGRINGAWVAVLLDQHASLEAARRLTFADLREQSQSRRDRWHTPETEPWTSADWSNAMGGEVGEAAEAAMMLIAALAVANGRAGNTVKKLRRHETGMADRIPVETLRQSLADELGDVVAYTDLLAAHFGFDLGNCVAVKFNRVSEREGFPERLPLPPSMAAERPAGQREHLRGCAALQGIGLPCSCEVGVVDGVAGDAPCTTCGRDNRNGTHSALEMTGHLSHRYVPNTSQT